jgi:hypothetical protein
LSCVPSPPPSPSAPVSKVFAPAAYAYAASVSGGLSGSSPSPPPPPRRLQKHVIVQLEGHHDACRSRTPNDLSALPTGKGKGPAGWGSKQKQRRRRQLRPSSPTPPSLPLPLPPPPPPPPAPPLPLPLPLPPPLPLTLTLPLLRRAEQHLHKPAVTASATSARLTPKSAASPSRTLLTSSCVGPSLASPVAQAARPRPRASRPLPLCTSSHSRRGNALASPLLGGCGRTKAFSGCGKNTNGTRCDTAATEHKRQRQQRGW